MSQQVNIGDKLWMWYGYSNLLVGHLIDVSPNKELIALCGMPHYEYNKLSQEARTTIPVSWVVRKDCIFVDRIPKEEIDAKYEAENKPLGFFAQK